MKTCSKCEIEKPLDRFTKRASSKDGLRGVCKECKKLTFKKWVESNPNYRVERDKKYRENNKEKLRLRQAEFRKNNPESRRKSNQKWDKNNPEHKRMIAAKRRARKLNATPHWLTEQDHKEIAKRYAYATYLTNLTGEDWHVDHIHPLQGKNICGLHHPDNLQVIPATENLTKSNKYEVQ